MATMKYESSTNMPGPANQAGGAHNRRSCGPTNEHGPLRELRNVGDAAPAPETVHMDGSRSAAAAEDDVTADDQSNRPRLTIRQLREAAQMAALAKQERQHLQGLQPPNGQPPQPSRKRSSVFGKLFQVREPTQVALNQVAAQMIAQHGSTSPTRVPNVRMEKMPEFVPKVNSKWDGIPSAAKADKEKKPQGQPKTVNRDSAVASHLGSRGSDGMGRGRRPLNSRNSSSTATTASSRSHGRSSQSRTNSTRGHVYSRSVNSSGDLASQQRTDHARPRADSFPSTSVRTPSTTGLPDSPPELPASARDVTTSAQPKRSIVDHGRPAAPPPLPRIRTPPRRSERTTPPDAPGIEELPPHSASPLATPQDPSPITPLPMDRDSGVYSTKSGLAKKQAVMVSPVIGAPPTSPDSKRRVARVVDLAFLAGEAQELVLADDDDRPRHHPPSDLPLRNWKPGPSATVVPSARAESSRARLGLRASKLFNDDESKSPPSIVRSPKSPAATDTRRGSGSQSRRSRAFGLLGKER